MEQIRPTEETAEAIRVEAEAAPARMQTFLGTATLALIFLASAGFTLAFLSESPALQQSPQIAAAAAIDPFASVSLHAQSAYVLDLTTGKVLFSKNPDAQLPLASLTKVPLALVIAEGLPSESLIIIPPHSTPDGAPIRLPAGLQFTARDLIDFTLVASSNEGAELLANAAGPSVARKYPEANQAHPVLWRMNNLAANMGLARTYFLNTSGLDMSSTQAGAYGSARDVARLFGYAASSSPDILEQTTRSKITIRATSGASVSAVNTDEALPSIPGLIFGKTGFTDLAGGNLAIVFEIGLAHPVVAVILHSTQEGRFEDMKKLIAATQLAITQGGRY